MAFRRKRLSQALAAALGVGVPYAHAQVVRDGTMGRAGPIAPQAIASPRFAGEYRILASDGLQRGGNLFHSFSQFDIAPNLRATFSGPGNVTNIISRVTGGTPSLIFGGLRSEIAGANLFLLNPSGILFGQNAVLDVSGSFYASTAHYLALSDGGRFDTNPGASTTVLTAAPPSAFGFLAPPAGIVVDRSNLTGAAGKSVTLVAGATSIAGGALIAPGGTVNIAAVGGAGQVSFTGSEALPGAGMARSSIDVTGGALLSASTSPGFGAGKVVLRGGRLTLQSSAVGLNSGEPGTAPGVVIDASESIAMIQGSLVGTSTSGAGSGGPVSVTTPALTMDASAITSTTTASGAAGSINVAVSRGTLSGGAFISSTVQGSGPAGSVTVTAAESLSLSGASDGVPTTISSVSSAAGHGSDVFIATPRLSLDGARISTGVSSSGAGGNIGVVASSLELVRGSGITSTSSGTGAAGGIAIAAGDLSASFSAFDASASGAGNAGSIAIDAARIAVTDNSFVNSTAASSASGTLSVTASESILLARGAGNAQAGDAGLFSQTLGSGRGGAMFVSAPIVTVDGALVRTRATGAGAAGAIAVHAEQLKVINGGQIDSSSFGAGAAGDLTVTATASAEITGRDGTGRLSGLLSAAVGSGRAGNLSLSAPIVAVDNALISADALSIGAPGNISITAQKIALTGGGVVSSSSAAPATGSTITLIASDSVTVAGQDGGANRSAVAGLNTGAGNGTAIVINAPTVTLDSGGISTAASGSGAGGRITIGAARVAFTNGAQVSSSSSGSGRAGDVSIAATESIAMSGTFGGAPAGIFVRSLGDGAGGTATLSAPRVTLDGAVINANTTGSGAAGNVAVSSGQLLLTNGGGIDSSTSARGPGGKVEILATESVVVSGANSSRASAITTTASGAGSAGEITIAAPLVRIDGGLISGETSGAGSGGNTTITAAKVEVLAKGQILSTTSGPGAGGRIGITASQSVTISSDAAQLAGAGVFGVSTGRGVGGDIDINAPILNIAGGSVAASAFLAGDAGNISLRGAQVNVTGGGIVDSSSRVASSAGRVAIDVTDSIEISGKNSAGQLSQISSVALGSGHGGEVLLRAPLVTVDRGLVRVDAGNSGTGGQITVDGSRVIIKNNGQLNSSSTDDATGGRVSVTAAESLTISDSVASLSGSGLFAGTTGNGRGGEIDVHAPAVSIAGGAIATSTSGAGDAGKITLQAGTVAVTQGGFIDSSSLGGAGAGGVISVTAAETLRVAGRSNDGVPSQISSATLGNGRGGDVVLTSPSVTVDNAVVRVDASGRGSAGRIGIDAQVVTLRDGGQLASGTSGAGDGGTTSVTASDSIVITGSNDNVRSRITNSSQGNGNAGQITLTAPAITLQDGGFVRGITTGNGTAGRIAVRAGTLTMAGGGEISTSTTGAGRGGNIDVAATGNVAMTDSSIRATSSQGGDAGSISLDAGRSLTMVRSAITTEANRADGGNIVVKAIDMLRMTDSEITTSVGNGSGNGGNITIDPIYVVLDSSRIIANAFGGNGGNIDITTDALLKSGDSVIQASSQLGVQGTIRISAPDSDLAGSLTPLQGGLIDPSQLLRQSCSARAASGGNSFVGVGHGGLPERPGSLAFSSYAPTRAITADERAPIYALLNEFSCAR